MSYDEKYRKRTLEYRQEGQLMLKQANYLKLL